MHCFWESEGNGSRRCDYGVLLPQVARLVALGDIRRLTVCWRPGLDLLVYMALWQAGLQQPLRLEHIEVLIDEAWTERTHPAYAESWAWMERVLAQYGPSGSPSWQRWEDVMGVQVRVWNKHAYQWPEPVSLWITCIPRLSIRDTNRWPSAVAVPEWMSKHGVRQKWQLCHPKRDAFEVCQIRTKKPEELVEDAAAAAAAAALDTEAR